MLGKSFVSSAAIASLFALAACGEQNTVVNPASDERVATGPAQPGTPGAMDTAQKQNKSGQTATNTGKAELTSDTRDYVQKAAMGDMFEIESSRLALTRSPNAEVKQFAQRMIDEHTKASDDMKARLARAGLIVELPTTLDADHKEVLDDVRAKNARDFDIAFIEEQKAAHEDALMLHRSYAMTGELADLKAFAADLVPKIEMHQQMATDLESKLRTRVSNDNPSKANTTKR
jgi:putative membrane protein